MDDATSTQIRNLVTAVTEQPRQLPVVELIEMAKSPSHNVTLDLAGEPPVAYARPRRHPALAGLTRREGEVAKLIASGYTNQQLAKALYISLATVKDHVHSILSKTGFENRSQVAAAWLGSTLTSEDRYST